MLYPIELRARVSIIAVVTAGSPRYPCRVAQLIEIEVKIAVNSAARIRAIVRKAGFWVASPRAFEQNLVLDDAAGSLKAKGLLLRVRTTGKRDAGQSPLCTFKGPAKETRTHHKQREEREFSASSAEECLAVLAGVGFRPAFRYEKFRTVYSRRARKGVMGNGLVVLDETPIGVFVELEGPATWIDRTAKELGFSRIDYITKSYARLWEQWCAEHELAVGDMVF